jgi:hypothetical protein
MINDIIPAQTALTGEFFNGILDFCTKERLYFRLEPLDNGCLPLALRGIRPQQQ